MLSQSTRTKYGRTPLIRTLVIRIADYPDRLGPSGRIFLAVKVLHLFFYGLNVSPSCQIHLRNYVIMFYLHVNKYVASSGPFTEIFFPLQTANVAYFKRKYPIIRIFCMSGWFALPVNPDKWSSAVCGIFVSL